MISKFRVKNFYSIKDDLILDFIPKSISDLPNNVFHSSRSILKTICIHGKNSSGKSNFIKAMSFLIELITNFGRSIETDGIADFSPFLLDDKSTFKNSEIEINFSIGKDEYRYLINFNSKLIWEEILWIKKSQKESLIFNRVNDSIRISKPYSTKLTKLFEFTRTNQLFLTIAAQFNASFASHIVSYFSRIPVIFCGNNKFNSLSIRNNIIDSESQRLILKIIRASELGFDSLIISKEGIKTAHLKYENGKAKTIYFDLDKDESIGTIKYVSLLGPIVGALRHGYPIFIDEFDSGIHHELGLKLIEMFNSEINNPKGAQFIFTTHNTKYLSNTLLRRDQQVNILKDYSTGQTRLRTTYDLKIRKDKDHEKPFVKDNKTLINEINSQLRLF